MTETILRNFKPGDSERFIQIQNECFRELEYLPRIKVGLRAIESEGSFLAEKDGAIVGSVGVFKLDRPGWFEIKNLAVRGQKSGELAKRLLAKAVDYIDSTAPGYVKAYTPAIQPFVDYYKQAGFEPKRRSLRIVWDLSRETTRIGKIETRELSTEHADAAADVWVKGLRPYWKYWIEESGGPEELAVWVKQSVPKREGWIGAFVDRKLVGLSIVRADSYGPGETRFNGAYVLPEFRDRGIGSALMNATIQHAKELGQKTMRVYTLALLDHLAPGAILYLKSGGRIEAEYLQLQRTIDS